MGNEIVQLTQVYGVGCECAGRYVMDCRATRNALSERDVAEIRRTTCVLVISECGDCLASLVDKTRTLQLPDVDRIRVGRTCLDIGDLPLIARCAHRNAIRAIRHRVGAEGNRVAGNGLRVTADRGGE